MDIPTMTAQVADIESKYRFGQALLGQDDVKEDNGQIMLKMEGTFVPGNGTLKTLCTAIGLSASEIKKFPIDAQVYALKSKFRVPTQLATVFYNGHPVGFKTAQKPMAPLSMFLKRMVDDAWKGWEGHAVSHDPVNGKLHCRLIKRDTAWPLHQTKPDDVWYPGFDMYLDYAEGRKTDLRALIFRQVCSNGLVRIFRSASIEGRYDMLSEESMKEALARLAKGIVPSALIAFNRVKETAEKPIERVKERLLKLNRMLGVKSKDVMDTVASGVEDKMQFYPLHNAYTFAAQKAPLVAEMRTIQSRTMRMVDEIATQKMLPYYDALFGEVTQVASN